MNEAFKEYIETFKDLDIPGKRKEIIRSINEVTATFEYFLESNNIKPEFLKNREILDLNNGQESEDDFLEALLVYIENAKSVMGQYLTSNDN